MKLTLQSSLSMQEIENNFKNVDLSSEIMKGLEEALTYEKGKVKTATIARKRELPNVNISE